jgi:hypothetical protein
VAIPAFEPSISKNKYAFRIKAGVKRRRRRKGIANAAENGYSSTGKVSSGAFTECDEKRLVRSFHGRKMEARDAGCFVAGGQVHNPRLVTWLPRLLPSAARHGPSSMQDGEQALGGLAQEQTIAWPGDIRILRTSTHDSHRRTYSGISPNRNPKTRGLIGPIRRGYR